MYSPALGHRAMCLSLLMLMLYEYCSGQERLHYNLSYKTGLPSNHVYCLKKDHYGYLWMATDKGVVKYNGYSLKKFGRQSGMDNDDIWSLYEDSKGRMWLSGIADHVGYIDHDQYRKCYMPPGTAQVYPRDLVEYNGHICFLSLSPDRSYWQCYLEHRDTFLRIDLPLSPSSWHLSLDPHLGLVGANGLRFYSLGFNKGRYMLFTYCADMGSAEVGRRLNYYISPWLFFSSLLGTNLVAIDIADCSKKRQITFLNGSLEKSYTAYSCDKRYYIVSNSHVYIYDGDLTTRTTHGYRDLIGNITSDGNISYCITDSSWGTCTATTQGGAYFNSDTTALFHWLAKDATGYHYVGHSFRNVNYWWNSNQHMLLSIDELGKAMHRKLTFFDVRKLIPYDARHALLLADTSVYLFNQNGSIATFFTPRRYTQYHIRSKTETLADHYRSALVSDARNLYTIGSGSGLVHFNIDSDTLGVTNLYLARGNDLIYDRKRQMLLTYDGNQVYLYHIKSGKTNRLSLLQPEDASNNKIEKILLDTTSGNAIVQYYDHIVAYDYIHNTVVNLMPNVIVENVYTFLIGRQLLVCGRFGVAQITIKGWMNFGAPLVFPNSKGIWYSTVSDACVSGTDAILNTDNGLLKISLNSGCSQCSNAQPAVKFTVSYKQSISNLHTGDTIRIDQNDRQLFFDIINPGGIGTTTFKCRVLDFSSSGWQVLPASEYSIPKLSPGYHTLELIISDGAWRSEPQRLILFIRPYWWQVPRTKFILYLGALCLIGLAIYLAVHITRKVMTGKNLRRQYLLELELKSLYAQISPHFIFNTLNSAQYLIGKGNAEEAYQHINKFSKLLRSYINSSRNKYIRLADELVNLRHYIELQQNRFKGKFNHSIQLDHVRNTEIMIPCLLLQPIVENAIEHGLFHKDEPGFLSLRFSMDIISSTLTCIVEDNGIGRKAAGLISSSSILKTESYGSKLVEELIEAYNRYERIEITINYVDKEKPETGTIVTLTIKYLS